MSNVIGHVWISSVKRDPACGRGWLPKNRNDGDFASDAELAAYKKTTQGHFLRQDEFPEALYAPRRWNDHKKADRHIFSYGHLVISEESAKVLSQFDLGEGTFYPVDLFHPDKKTRHPGQWYHLTVAAKKNAVLPEQSSRIKHVHKASGEYPDVWGAPPNFKDDEITFGASVLEGPDIWTDEHFFIGYMISERLYKAMKKAKISKHWSLRRAPVIDGAYRNA